MALEGFRIKENKVGLEGVTIKGVKVGRALRLRV